MKYLNKIFVVTGGNSGLGAGTTRHLLSRGAHVAVIDLNLPVQSSSNHIATSDRFRSFKADVTNTEQVAGAVQQTLAWADECKLRIEGIVTCAGYLGPAKILSKSNKPLSLDLLKKVVDINLIGTIDVIRQFLPHMAAQDPDEDGHRGVLITVSSVSAYDGQEGQVPYSASKGAVAAMTLPMARDLGARGIRVVSIAPGIFDTEMVAKMPKAAQDSTRKSFEYPARAGRTEEFAALVESIVDNHMLNGTVIRLDGASRFPARL